MRKDAKIALLVILALMVLVVIIWGRNPKPEDDLANVPQRPPATDLATTRATTPVEPATPADRADEHPSPARGGPSPVNPAAMIPTDRMTANRATINSGGTPPDSTKGLVADNTKADHKNDRTDTKTGQAEIKFPKNPPDQGTQAAGPAKPLATHVVAKGDTYRKLARLYYKDEAKWQVILDANKIPQQSLRIGQKLVIPALIPPAPKQPTTGVAQLPPASTTPPDATPPKATSSTPTRTGTPGTSQTYKVKPGQSFMQIAREVYHDGSKWRTLYQANRAKLPDPSDPESLRTGTVLTVPQLATARSTS